MKWDSFNVNDLPVTPARAIPVLRAAGVAPRRAIPLLFPGENAPADQLALREAIYEVWSASIGDRGDTDSDAPQEPDGPLWVPPEEQAILPARFLVFLYDLIHYGEAAVEPGVEDYFHDKSVCVTGSRPLPSRVDPEDALSPAARALFFIESGTQERDPGDVLLLCVPPRIRREVLGLGGETSPHYIRGPRVPAADFRR